MPSLTVHHIAHCPEALPPWKFVPAFKAVVTRTLAPIPKHGYLTVRANEYVLVLHDAGWLYADARRALSHVCVARCGEMSKH